MYLLFVIWGDGEMCRWRRTATMQTSLHAPMNTQQRVPGNNQTPNNAVIALVISDVLPLSFFHNKSLSVRPWRRRCGAGGSLPQPPNTKLCYWRLRGAQCLLMPPPVSALILEMFSVANKSVMWSHTCAICKWIALAHIASDGNQKKKRKEKHWKGKKKTLCKEKVCVGGGRGG